MPPKGSLNLSAIDESPGGRMEHSLRSIPALYPELSFDTTSSQRSELHLFNNNLMLIKHFDSSKRISDNLFVRGHSHIT